jgi:hypothetical protein
MSKVYVVVRGEVCEGYSIVSVHSTLVGAQKAMTEIESYNGAPWVVEKPGTWVAYEKCDRVDIRGIKEYEVQ